MDSQINDYINAETRLEGLEIESDFRIGLNDCLLVVGLLVVCVLVGGW